MVSFLGKMLGLLPLGSSKRGIGFFMSGHAWYCSLASDLVHNLHSGKFGKGWYLRFGSLIDQWPNIKIKVAQFSMFDQSQPSPGSDMPRIKLCVIFFFFWLQLCVIFFVHKTYNFYSFMIEHWTQGPSKGSHKAVLLNPTVQIHPNHIPPEGPA